MHRRSAGRAPRPANTPRMANIAVFCGARVGSEPGFVRLAEDAARAIVARGYGIVYGGGRVGLMGVLADAALAAGGSVTGVIPRALQTREIAHDGLTRMHVVESMHERKALMEQLSSAFIALPGGYGTLDEFAEILTWAQLRIHGKPIGLLNAAGFYDGLLAQFDTFVQHGFVTPANLGLFRSAETIDALLDAIT